MDLPTIKDLFEIYLTPIQKDISELKQGQLQLIEIAKTQTKHSVEIIDIKKDVDECSENVKKMKETGNSRLWEVIRLGVAGFVGAIIAKFI